MPVFVGDLRVFQRDFLADGALEVRLPLAARLYITHALADAEAFLLGLGHTGEVGSVVTPRWTTAHYAAPSLFSLRISPRWSHSDLSLWVRHFRQLT